MLEKMDLVDHWLTQTGRKSCNKNMNIAAFSWIEFELTLIKQTA